MSGNAKREDESCPVENVVEPFVEAYRTFTEKLQDTLAIPGSPAAAQSAYDEYMRQLGDLWCGTDVQRRANEAYKQLIEAW